MRRLLLLLVLIVTLQKLGQCNPILTKDSISVNKKNSFSAGILFTTNGFGLQLAQQIDTKNKLAIKLSGTHFLYSINNQIVTIDGKNIYFFGNSLTGIKLIVNGKINFGSANLILDYHPFGNALRISTGCGLVFSRINFIATPKDSLKQGDISIGPEEQGNIFYDLKTQLVCPYLGIGLGRAIPKRRVGFNFEIGSYYIGAPKLSFKTTGMLEPTSAEEGKLKENLKNYYLLPVLLFTLNIKISK